MRKAIAATVAAAALAVGLAPAAQADDYTDTSICIGLSRSPTVQQIEYQIAVIMAFGYDAYTAGQIIGQAISSSCPQYWYVAQEYIDISFAHPGVLL